ncbi:hypothetical protein AAE478_007647 [Parahypoxylon ruwenzoriense]
MAGYKEPPNGGWRAWSQVLASFLTNFCTLGLSNSFGIFQAFYEHEVLSSYSASNISWIGTTMGFLLSIFGAVSGFLYDRGHVRRLMYAGTFLSIAGLLGTSFAEQYHWVFLSFGVVLGFGCGAMFVPSIAIVQNYFSTRSALANAIASSGSSIGGIVYPILFRQLHDRVGFPWTVRIFAFINGILLMTACLLFKPRKMVKEADRAAEEGELDETRISQRPHNKKPWCGWVLLLFGIIAMGINIGVDVPLFFVPTFVRMRLMLSPQVADSLLAGINGGSFLGRIFFAWCAQNAGALIIWQFSILGACVLLFCWFLVWDLAGIIAFVIVYGFFMGGLISVVPNSLKSIFPDPEVFGARLGFVEAFQGLGFLVGPPIAGAILETSAGYMGVSMFTGSLYVVAFLLVGFFTWGKYIGRLVSKKDQREDPDSGIAPQRMPAGTGEN